MLREEFKNIADSQIRIKFDKNILSKIADDAYNPEFGARNIKRYIEENVESFISRLILEDKIKPGEVNLSVDNSGSFVVT
ncbi:Chaperone protein ClpB [compost metagenome]